MGSNPVTDLEADKMDEVEDAPQQHAVTDLSAPSVDEEPNHQVPALENQDPGLRKRKSSSGDDNPESFVCELCGKTFKSLKSKYGHLRSHPNRPSRRRTTGTTSASPVFLANSTSPDTAPIPTGSWIQNTALFDVMAAAEALVLMSHGVRSPSDSHTVPSIFHCYSLGIGELYPEIHVADEAEAQDQHTDVVMTESSPKGRLFGSEGDRGKEKETGQGEGEQRAERQEEEISHFRRFSPVREEPNLTSPPASFPIREIPIWLGESSNQTGTKTTRMEANGSQESSPVSEGTKRYMCDVCNKSFPSHQALGGHKASHYKHKNDLERSMEMEESNRAQKVKTEDDQVEPSRVHQCNLCPATFSTGQALGGHKRKHYVGQLENRGIAQSSAIAVDNLPPPPDPPECVDQERKPKVLHDFDLNVAYTEEQEES